MHETLRAAGLIYGPDVHHLDHLGPLCSFLGIPLIVTEEKIASLAEKFYPELKVILTEVLTSPEYVVSHFDLLFYSIPRALFDESFFFAEKLAGKRLHTIWCPHGNSDKGHEVFYMEALKKEEAALVYGKQMIEFLKRKHVFDQLKGHVITGNYRHLFYLRHKAFYERLIREKIDQKLPKAEKTLLYAPTWRDCEKSSSFFDAASPLLENLPSRYNLIVKLHPNLYLQEPLLVEEIALSYRKCPNILFVEDFPAIYPLLARADVYIGDMSSIGYDFLTFNRPMFFLNQNERSADEDLGLYLFRCGVEIKREDYSDIHARIDHYLRSEVHDFSEIRKEVYALAFASGKNLEELKTEIEHLCRRL